MPYDDVSRDEVRRFTQCTFAGLKRRPSSKPRKAFALRTRADPRPNAETRAFETNTW